MRRHHNLLTLVLGYIIFCTHAIATPVQGFNCQYQLQNWSDAEARHALTRWPQDSKRFILVQSGRVSATLDRADCSRLISWLRHNESATSALQLTLFHGKHPSKIIPNAAQAGDHNNRRYSSDTHRPRSEKIVQFPLTLGQETRISQSLWQGKQDPSNRASSEFFHTTGRPALQSHALSKKPPRVQPPGWLRVKPAFEQESMFSFTVLQTLNNQDALKLKLKIQQWQYDATQERWLERRQRVEQLTLSQWHNLDEVFNTQQTKPQMTKKRYSTQQQGPLKRFYFHIEAL